MASKLVLADQPLDPWLIQNVPLYKRSRALYLKMNGRFKPATISLARSITSPSLIVPYLEYNPIAREVAWSFSDSIQKKQRKHLEMIKLFTTNVFHEQNHRILWRLMAENGAYCPQTPDEARRYMNLAESFAVTLDHALTDSLGVQNAKYLFKRRLIYSRPSDFLTRYQPTYEQYRTYLHAGAHAAYLRLTGVRRDVLFKTMYRLFQGADKRHITHATQRAYGIGSNFITFVNPHWQRQHMDKVMQQFRAPRGKKSLCLAPWQQDDRKLTQPLLELVLDHYKIAV